MSVDTKALAENLLPVLRDGARGLWDGPEDEAFLKEMAKEAASLAARKVAGDTTVEMEIAIIQETVRQRTVQKSIRVNGIGEEVLPRILGIAFKALLAGL